MLHEKMKAVVYHGPDDIRVEAVPKPAPGNRELVIDVQSASICGTDLRIFHGKHRMYPQGTHRIPGHEVVGIISEIGQEVEGYTLGQKVFIAPNMGCGHCQQCIKGNNNLCSDFTAIGITINGGFAEQMLVPETALLHGNIIPISDSMDNATAVLLEPFACVLRGQNAVNIRPGDVVLIMGAGPIGLMHSRLAKAQGAGLVIVSEPNHYRADQARNAGADITFNPLEQDLKAEIQQLTNNQMADVIITAAPAHIAQESALEIAGIGGRINFFGGLPKDKPLISFNSNLVHYKELQITGTTACSTADCWQAFHLVNQGLVDLSNLISHRFALDEAQNAFRQAEGQNALKIAIEP